jgi:hypothetical protein
MAQLRDAGIFRLGVMPLFTNGSQGNTAGDHAGVEDFPGWFFSGWSNLPSREDRKTPFCIRYT